MFDINSWRNQIGFNHQTIDLDSILKNQNFRFNFDFDQEGDSIFFNGKHFNIGKLKDQIMNSFENRVYCTAQQISHISYTYTSNHACPANYL